MNVQSITIPWHNSPAERDVMPKQKLLSVSEVCERFNCEAGNVRKAIKAGKLRATKVGEYWTIRESDADAWWASIRHRSRKP